MRGWDARGSNTSPGAWGFRAPERNSHKLLCFLGELGWLHPMVDARYPEVAAQLVVQLEGHPATPLPWGSNCRSQGFNGDHELRTSLLEVSLVGRKTPPPPPTTPTRSSQAPSDKDGNMKFRPGLRNISKVHCWTGCQTVPRHP